MATYKIFVADLSHHKTKKRHNSLLYNLLCRYELRRQDSNMRPPGYEPGELPTAPLRDINHRNQINNRSISELRVQRYDFLLKPPNVFAIIFRK